MIKSALYYWLTCDRCGQKSTKDTQYEAWSSEVEAVDQAVDFEWLIDEHGNGFCDKCVQWCPKCEDKLISKDRLACQECS